MRRINDKLAGTLLVLLVVISSCSRTNMPEKGISNLPNTVILKWNEIAYEAFGGVAYQHSLMASRINAMTHLAMHDAINAVQPVYATYAFTGKDEKADPISAAVTAAHAVLLNEIPDKKSMLDSALNESLKEVTEGEAKQKGIQLGKQVAVAVIQKRTNDGAHGDVIGAVPPSTVPGVYQTVPPFTFAFAPHWKDLPAFSLQSPDQFRVDAPPAINSAAYTESFNEVKETGKLNSATRTADQTSLAKFWYEFSEAGWNRVARIAAVNKNLNLVEAARLFALVDMVLADAYIAGWDSKIHHNLWRPYTAIRNAATDGNDNTSADTQWEPSMPTPPIHDYPSTHSALGNAAATVLARLLGDNTAFTMSSPTAQPAGSTRSYNSFSQAADENADSRVRAGIHFRFSCEAGQELGTKIGNWAVDHSLKKIN